MYESQKGDENFPGWRHAKNESEGQNAFSPTEVNQPLGNAVFSELFFVTEVRFVPLIFCLSYRLCSGGVRLLPFFCYPFSSARENKHTDIY